METSAKRQELCRKLSAINKNLQNLCQELSQLEELSGNRYTFRRELRTAREGLVQRLQYLSWLQSRECSKCKNM